MTTKRFRQKLLYLRPEHIRYLDNRHSVTGLSRSDYVRMLLDIDMRKLAYEDKKE